ncbi:MAG: hypothetical protein IJT97_11780, partial [Bacteroidaceae bacterium]|nr:hypothetical protein [Bacteroidaceae bacterium]
MNRILLLIALTLLTTSTGAQKKNNILSQSFELRYVTNDPKANGETDYKGATAWMTTDQRVEYLHHWQQYAGKYFGDMGLDQQVVSDEEVAEAMKCLKPQPLPKVRQQLRLEEWRWAPSTSHHKPLAPSYRFDRQTWRFRIEMEIKGMGSVRLMDLQNVV